MDDGTLSYRAWIEEEAARLGSDGCSFATGAYRFCCLEHDVLYRTGTYRDGTLCTKAEADDRFRSCIQRASPLGWWSPIAWVRWVKVRMFGRLSALRSMESIDSVAVEARAHREAILKELT